MRSKELQAQSERALAVAEATLSLLQQRETETQALSRTWESRLLQLEQKLSDLIERHEVRSNTRYELQNDIAQKRQKALEDGIGEMQSLAGIPRGDTPTVDELLEAARHDPAVRKRVESTLSELEFADPIIEFN